MADVLEHLRSALGDRYDVERLLGEGGMATVFLAKDLRHGRQVAIKTLRAELAASIGADRFLREIQLAANLQHPNILTLYDSGDAQGALALWKKLHDQGQVEPAQLGHMAYAAQVGGDEGLADTLIARRMAGQPTAEDQLLFAQIHNLRGQPEKALPLLEAAEAADAEHSTGFPYEVRATRGRSFRLLGRTLDAKVVLE